LQLCEKIFIIVEEKTKKRTWNATKFFGFSIHQLSGENVLKFISRKARLPVPGELHSIIRGQTGQLFRDLWKSGLWRASPADARLPYKVSAAPSSRNCAIVRHLLATLRPKAKRIAYLKFLRGEKVVHIADLLGMTPEGVNASLRRTSISLRERIQSRQPSTGKKGM
jgi:hypothetical protein